jgi:hypothetical protein
MPRMTRQAERDAWTEHVLGAQPKKQNKYHNAGKKDAGGYDSKHEMEIATGLHALAACGKILELKEQPRFELVPADPPFTACVYIADFSYIDLEGNLHVLDAKAADTKTQVYLLKKKLLWHIHKIRIEEIYESSPKAPRRAFLYRLPHK